MKKAYLVLNGNDFFNLKNSINKEYFVVAVDGGFHHLNNNNLKVDLLLGDFDSFKNPKLPDVEIIKFPTEKDFSDLYLALEEMKSRGFKEIYVDAVFGGRFDHELANYENAISFARYFDKIVFLGQNQTVHFLTKNKNLNLPIDTIVSFFSGTEKVSNLSLNGFKYSLDNYSLKRESPLGLSNVTTGSNQNIKFSDGVLVMSINLSEALN
ncbi:MAG: thiamine diphosphokinase [Candidatus Delongbacteria bacterium]|nr:thiamine diphosphokinase [Candidatus Delongbacteria bacterium]MBN2835564.1 thiamine diphosphokinase [Candidatus Delongbacteria bacterium]